MNQSAKSNFKNIKNIVEAKMDQEKTEKELNDAFHLSICEKITEKRKKLVERKLKPYQKLNPFFNHTDVEYAKEVSNLISN